MKEKLTTVTFSVHRFAHNNAAITYYTGFTFQMLMACFNFLKRSAESMSYWKGSATVSDSARVGCKPGRKPSLELLDQFFLTLIHLRLGYGPEHLGHLFNIDASTASCVFCTWVNLMYHKFQGIFLWSSRERVDNFMPPCFNHSYPSTRIIIDCTEFFLERP